MPTELSAITNFLQIAPGLGTAGMPTQEQIPLLAAAGYQVVINLAVDDLPSVLAEEEKLVNDCGMHYVHIPVIWLKPTLANVKDFFATMQQQQGKKVFVHCVLNMRVSVFVYLYRVLILNVSPRAAYADVLKIWQPDEVWQPFILETALAWMPK